MNSYIERLKARKRRIQEGVSVPDSDFDSERGYVGPLKVTMDDAKNIAHFVALAIDDLIVKDERGEGYLEKILSEAIQQRWGISEDDELFPKLYKAIIDAAKKQIEDTPRFIEGAIDNVFREKVWRGRT